MNLVKWIKKKLDPTRMTLSKDAHVHDCRSSYWGHSLRFGDKINDFRSKCSGHLTPIPRNGDLAIVSMQSGKDAVYIFDKVEPCSDPPDMFFAEAISWDYYDIVKPKMDQLGLTIKKKLYV